MENIADYGNAQSVKVAFVVANCKHVEQCLSGMCMAAISRIDYMNLWPYVTRYQMRRPTLGMPHHEHIGMHGGKIIHRVQQCLPFRLRRGGDIQVDNIGG